MRVIEGNRQGESRVGESRTRWHRFKVTIEVIGRSLRGNLFAQTGMERASIRRYNNNI